MPVFRLTDKLVFPHPRLAEPEGLLAAGGDLSPERLLLAYSAGIFPWYSKGEPILWWSPDPRFVLFPGELKVSASLKQSLRNRKYQVASDRNFPEVIRQCAKTRRKGERGTWITAEMEAAYIRLHELGFAHSVETYLDGRLVGGLYGVSLGKAFFGESMFYKKRDASKVALYYFAEALKAWGFHFIDSQVYTEHLEKLGAREIPRAEYLERLAEALESRTMRGKWSLPPDILS